MSALRKGAKPVVRARNVKAKNVQRKLRYKQLAQCHNKRQ